MKKTIREAVTGPLSLEYFAERFQAGWKIAGIEWVRDSAENVLPEAALTVLNEGGLPYGFRLSGDGVVEENPAEAAVLLLILDQVIREKRVPEIARELNERGYSTRTGMPWRASDVFNLMPRLIDVGPSLLKSDAWRQRRTTIQPIVERPN